jgi:DNA replication protein DnaC
MLIQQTIDKLQALRLSGMARALEQQMRDPEIHKLSFEDRLSLLVDTEATERESKQLASRLKAAKPKQQACIEDVKTNPTCGVTKAVLKQLSTGDWIRDHRNVLISGPTGIGKTYLACSLINAACRSGYKAVYYRAHRLFHNTAIAKSDGTYMSFLQKLAKINLLVIDDFGHASITDEISRDLLEIIDDRDVRSTLIASQLPIDQWHQTFTNPTIADAILDRVVHSAYKFSLIGPTRRKPEDIEPDTTS